MKYYSFFVFTASLISSGVSYSQSYIDPTSAHSETILERASGTRKAPEAKIVDDNDSLNEFLVFTSYSGLKFYQFDKSLRNEEAARKYCMDKGLRLMTLAEAYNLQNELLSNSADMKKWIGDRDNYEISSLYANFIVSLESDYERLQNVDGRKKNIYLSIRLNKHFPEAHVVFQNHWVTVPGVTRCVAESNENSSHRALMKAIKNKEIKEAQLLLNRGINIEKVNDRGETPLRLAAENNDPKMVELLLSEGANINASNDYGFTALMLAAQNEDADTVELLLANGADTSLENRYRRTVFSIAHDIAHFGNREILETLSKHVKNP